MRTNSRLLLAGTILSLVVLPAAVFGVEIDEHPETRPDSPMAMTVTWETDVPSDSLVEYGVDETYAHTYYDPAYVTLHECTVPLFGVEEMYDIRVTSSDGVTDPAVNYGFYYNEEFIADIEIPEADEIVSEEVQVKAVACHAAVEVLHMSVSVSAEPGGLPVFIGEDFDGTGVIYNTFQPAPTGDGWSVYWNTFGFPEGPYTVMVQLDTTIGTYYDSQHVWVDQTPPIPSLDDPEFGDRCYGVTTINANGASDSNQCIFAKQKAEPIVDLPSTTGMIQTNYNFKGRPGSMMCHPTAQAMILWTNPKVRAQYTNDSRNKNHTESYAKTLLIWDLARCKGTNSSGTNSGNARTGSRRVTRYVRGKQSGFDWSYSSFGGPVTIKKLKKKATQPKGRVRGVGICVAPTSNPNGTGHAMVVKKIDDNAKTDSSGKKYYELTVTDPATGQNHTVRAGANGQFTYPGGGTVFIRSGFRFTGSDPSGEPMPLGATNDDWEIIGTDTDPSDGWSIDWDAGAEDPGLYYIKAEATQADGLTGDDMTELAVPITVSVMEAKMQPDGMPVDVQDSAVSHAEAERFWAETTDRVSAIQVIGGYPAVARDDAILEIKGSMDTVGMERVIKASDVVVNPISPHAIGPLAIPNRYTVGGDFEYDPIGGTGQMGGPGAYGINNVALLVRTWGFCIGNATSPEGDEYYIIDDGSADGPWPIIGVLVSTEETVVFGDYVLATGICSVEDWGEGWILPIIRTRDSNDIQILPIP